MDDLEIPRPGEFHIYQVASKGDKNILSNYEIERYNNFSNSLSGRNFLNGHSAARKIIASYTGKNPSKLEFKTTPEGKPFFKCTPNLHFNLSHSGEFVFIAFSCEPVGFDIENMSRKADFRQLAKRFFHAQEIELMDRSAKPEHITFLELWTAKEAILKLFGVGIASGLDKILVLNHEAGVFNKTKVHLSRYLNGDFLGTLASFSEPRRVREFTF